MKEMQKFISMLYEVEQAAFYEKCIISSGGNSAWEVKQLEQVVLPEVHALLSYALAGKVFFRYGKGNRLLESTYLLTDSLQNLSSTTLGKKIIELQRVYEFL